MVGKMTGRQVTALFRAISILIAGGYSFTAWLEMQKAVRLEEIKSQEHQEALKSLSYANEGQVKVFQRLIDYLEKSGAEGAKGAALVTSSFEALLKAASKTEKSTINETQVSQSDAATLRMSASIPLEQVDHGPN